MQTFKTLPDAIALAEFAHRNQVDKAGLPYIDHPRRVLAKVQAQGALPYVQIAAILHDVTEDTKFTPQMLLDLGFSEAAVEVVKLLDRGEAEKEWTSNWKSYMPEYAGDLEVDEFKREQSRLHKEFYYIRIKTNPGAMIVKKADIEDNLSTWRLSYLPYETQARLIKKYEYAMEILCQT